MRKFTNPAIDTEDYVVPVELGGTGAQTLAKSAEALKLVTTAMKGTPGGPVGLDANNKILAASVPDLTGTNKVNIQGNFSPVVGEIVFLTITDFDSKKAYAITVKYGSFYRKDEVIIYTAPANPVAEILTVGGREFQFNVRASVPQKPSVLTPANLSMEVIGPVSATTSAFAVKGTATTHASTDWQVASDPNFTTIRTQGVSDTVNKTTFSFPLNDTFVAPNLNYNTQYYFRVRYRGANGEVSDWSEASTFRTSSSFATTTETARLPYAEPSNSELFGFSVAISADATRIAVGAVNASSDGRYRAGKVLVFFVSGGVWSLEAKLIAPDIAPYAQFGQSICMTPNGATLVIGASGDQEGVSNSPGKFYHFTRAGTVWNHRSTNVIPDTFAGDMVGMCVRVNTGDTLTLVVTAGRQANVTGVAYIFTRTTSTSSTWVLQATLKAGDATSNRYFGFTAEISSAGDRVLIGSTYAQPGGLYGAGAVYSFVRSAFNSGFNWTQEAIITPTDKAAGDIFGENIVANDAFTRAFITSQKAKVNGVVAGAVYVFERAANGTVWTQVAKITAPDPSADADFGFFAACNTAGTVIYMGSIRARAGKSISPGALYTYMLVGGNWVYQGKISSSNGADGDFFGYSVAAARNAAVLAVGAPLTEPPGYDGIGSVYVFSG